MNIFKEELLFELEDKYSQLLFKLGLPDGNNRFKQAFNNYKDLAAEMAQTGTEIIPEKWSTDFKHAVYDLTELLEIYNAVNDYSDVSLLREKIKILNGGTSSPADETGVNTAARDVQFELKLLSELTKAGITCELAEPKPDIKIKSSLIGHSYAIECKRIFSSRDSSVHDNINSARNQLKELFMNDQQITGIIALDVTRRLTKGTDYLRVKNEAVALAKLSHDLEQFRVKYMRYFSSDKIGNKRILAVLLHASVYTYLEDQGLASHGSYTVIHEIHSSPYSKALFKELKRDIIIPFARNKDPLNEPYVAYDPYRMPQL